MLYVVIFWFKEQEGLSPDAGLPGAILPGLLCASIFPAIIAQQFPGAVYISQTLKFRRPVQVSPLIPCHSDSCSSFRYSMSYIKPIFG